MKPKTIVFFIFLFSLLIDGVFPELLFVFSVVFFFITEYKNVKKMVGRRNCAFAIAYILFFLSLFVIQLSITEDVEVARLYGLTKCICAPALFFLLFYRLAKNGELIQPLLLFVIISNVVYTGYLLISGFDYEGFSSFIGSYNGSSSLAVVSLPCIIYFWKKNRKNANPLMSFLLITAFLTSLLMVLVSDSGTALLILALQCLFGILVLFKFKFFSKKIFKVLLILSILVVFFGIVLVASKYIKTTGEEIGTRTGLWSTAYEHLLSFDLSHIIFGTGNDYIKTLTKTLEPHNMFMEILLIYGFVGLSIFMVFFVANIIKFLRIKYSNTFLVSIISMFSYLLVCFIHPFFTGVFVYQALCLLLIYSVSARLMPETNAGRTYMIRKRKIIRITRSKNELEQSA